MNWNENPEIIRAHLAGTDPDLETFAFCEEMVFTVCAHNLKEIDSPLLVEIGEEHPCDSENICTCVPVGLTREEIEQRRNRAESLI